MTKGTTAKEKVIVGDATQQRSFLGGVFDAAFGHADREAFEHDRPLFRRQVKGRRRCCFPYCYR